MYFKIKTRLLSVVIALMSGLILLASCNAKDNHPPDKSNLQSTVFQSVIDTLLSRGVDSAFINKYISSSKLEFSDKFVKINVTGYLSKTDYSNVTSPTAVKKTKEFLRKHLSTLKQAEQTYNVPKEIIVAILWVETRLGTYLGNNHLPSVFFSTALVSEEKYIAINNKVIDEHTTNDSLKVALKEKILQRSASKSKWAVGELIAMATIEKQSNIDFDKIHGSWAGAFGISQFLPSSYQRAAVDGDGNGIVDLFNIEDAIFSVGNYLKEYKWDSFSNKKKAIFSYNNSSDYAEQVIKLSEIISKKK